MSNLVVSDDWYLWGVGKMMGYLKMVKIFV